jgi:hypothetical protein
VTNFHTQTGQPIEPGYRENARGQLVRESGMTEIEKLGDELTGSIAAEWLDLQARTRALKRRIFAEMAALAEVAASQHKVTLGGDKGNMTIRTYNGKFKVERSAQEFLVFDENVMAAKQLLEEFVEEKTDGVDPDLVVVLDRTFRRGEDGRLSVQRLTELLTYGIKHPKWAQAMDIINEAMRVGGVRSYVRLHRRVEGRFDKYESVPLDIAKL